MSFKAFCLCLIILALGIFIYLKVETLGSSTSSFNQTTRFQLGRHQIWRSLLNLHQPGDARATYLLGNTPIDIEVDQPDSDNLPDSVIQQFAAQVTAVTGRMTNVYDMDSLPSGTLTDADIAHAVQVDKRQYNLNDPIVFIIYADDFTTSTNEVGKTVEEFGMVISNYQLTQLTLGYPDALPQYQESTMLHEFGHQLGLDHNQQTGCIMNPDIENASAPAGFQDNYTPTAFCQYELNQIAQIKAGL
jgi:predicted Zn-dependent protease